MFPPNVLTFLIVFVIIWLAVITGIIAFAFVTYRKLTADIDKKDFASVLAKIKESLKDIDQDVASVESAIQQLQIKIKPHIQKLGFVRYNPFGDTGGDQSFCICLLDQNDNGIMITSLHTRNQTRLYAKQVSAGKNQEGFEFSKEEALCIKTAKSWSKNG